MRVYRALLIAGKGLWILFDLNLNIPHSLT